MFRIPISHTEININDYSEIKEQVDLVNVIPLYLTVITSDKGPEEMIEVGGDTFYKLYGDKKTLSYKRHGQPLIQASAAIDAGARLLCKRVVAQDSTLANLTVFAETCVEKRKIAKTKQDNVGRTYIVYEDPTKESSEQNEFKWDGEGKYIPKMIDDPESRDAVCIRYFTETFKNKKDIKSIINEVKEKRNANIYPLFTITDIGRGSSNKSIRISPSYYSRYKFTNMMKHSIEIIENDKVIESSDFSFYPHLNVNGVDLGMNAVLKGLKQIKIHQYEDSVNDLYEYFIKTTMDKGGNEEEYLKYLQGIDVLFGRDKRKEVGIIRLAKNTKEENKLFHPDSEDEDKNIVNLTVPGGLTLTNGSNGNFGDDPFGTKEYIDEVIKFFDGDITNAIYDIDNYKVDLILDANYPMDIKNAISNYVNDYRDDCEYIRDYGLGCDSMQEILQINAGMLSSYRIADYYLSYDIIDPCSNRQVPVTMTYYLAKQFVEHFKHGRHRPCAGERHDFVINDCIPGTESFIPTRTKYSDQREILAEHNINYAVYHDNKLVVESTYTTQKKYSQLSHLHNALNIQRLVKLIRTKCPKTRYAFINGKDFEAYKKDIKAELNLESGNFAFLDVKFLMDETSITNNQVYVVVEVCCKAFINSEKFDINIINVPQHIS